MVVKSELKLIKSLHQKKYRNEHGLFLIEGKKAVIELYGTSYVPYRIYATKDVALPGSIQNTVVATENEIRQMSALKTPNGIIGVFKIPKPKPLNLKGWAVALDDVRDPGNLGTIIRLCNWFGVTDLICSPDTVDCFNPKVLQATMGAISRVNVVYMPLPELLSSTHLPVYGAFMNGDAVYQKSFGGQGILVLGNEGKGISGAVGAYCHHRVSVPQFGDHATESLNVATAAAILLNEIRRGQ